MRKVITWIIIVALLGGGIAAFLWWRNTQATAQQSSAILRTGQVTRGDLAITVVASGNVAVNNKLDLRFDTSGTISRVNVRVNQRVRAGEELARLSTADLERAMQQAEIALEQATLNRSILVKPASDADVKLAQLTVQSAAQALDVARMGKQTAQIDADAMLVQAQRARENAFKDYRAREGTNEEERARTTYQNAAEQERITTINAEVTVEQAQAQWLAAYNRYQQAAENMRKLEQGPDAQQIRQAELQIEQAQLNLDQAQERLANAQLTAPFAGLIAAVNVQEGLLASPGAAAFTLVDDSQFYVDVTVDEIDIGKISIGQTADVTLDAYPNDVLVGEVTSIAPAALNVGGIISYRLRVRLSPPSVPPDGGDEGVNVPPDGGDEGVNVPTPGGDEGVNVPPDGGDERVNVPTPGGDEGGAIRDGMTASIVIHTDLIEGILLAPNWAVRTDQSSGEAVLYCYVLRADGVPERRAITLGRYNETTTEVLSGLQDGETVVLIAEERNLLELAITGR